MERLAHSYQVIAPDLYGYGDSPEWSLDQVLSLGDEMTLLTPVLKDLCGPFHLIGHSYGAAVAMTIAHEQPTRVRSLTLYEPVLFSLLFEADSQSEAAQEILGIRESVRSLVIQEKLHEAGRLFVDYWSGDGVWETFQEWQRQAVAKRMPKVVADFDAVVGHTTPLAAYRELDIPTLLLYGMESPESTRKIAEQLWNTLPKAEVRGMMGLGHMGPVTHAEQVARVITGFLDLQPTGILVHQLRRSRKK